MSEESEPRTPEEIEADIQATREELGDTVEALAAKTDVKGRARAKASETKEAVTEKLSGIGDSAREAAPESASAGAQQAAQVVKDNPDYVILASTFAAGVLAGWIARGR